MSANTLTTAGELVGLLLASYGLVRESFAALARPSAYGEERYGEGVYGGGVSRFTEGIIRLALWFRLIPRDKQLTITDRKRNAALAISGVLIGALALILELIHD